ncbi:unnamed protein product [Macrosiphum euphorbiae]|uniref:Transposase domain-containing protein n=1 Tax=Macrosiphum euphorbiae TaxID=13131 RepID=A0AAV0Y2A3_9HEMI|nr:unnamed protein product [Macrosiphum euphorbiae]
MAHRQHFSKSTKRRRFIEEVDVVDLFRENSGESLIQLSEVIPIASTSSHENEYTAQSIILKSSSCSDTDDLYNTNNSDECELLDSSSDSDIDDSTDELLYDIQDSGFNLCNNDAEPILKVLAQWAVGHNITNVALSALLKSLKSHKCFNKFPIDARTILKTSLNNHAMHIQSVTPGKYYHFGISNELKKISNFLNICEDSIYINIGIDGLPISKSSGSTFWPILGSIENVSSSTYVFLVGLYWGLEKPLDSNLYLSDLVNELKELSHIGISTPYGKKYVVVNCICCDVPAKSFILKTKGHTGFSSCLRCFIDGVRIGSRTCFPGTRFIKKTHTDFINRTHEEHHMTDSISILTDVPHIDMVCNFSLDYMHLVCLGVVKKLILLWLGNLKCAPLSVRLQSRSVHVISSNHLSLRPFITNDFSRYPRSLSDVSRWKATEFRLFLLYTGPIALQGVLKGEVYKHFLCLHVCFRILLTPSISIELIDYSEKLLVYFVDKYETLYGKEFNSHNIHGLLHIVDDYRKFGSLDRCSCFPFENYMKFLKKMIRKHEKPLEQVIKRYEEISEFCKPTLVSLNNHQLHVIKEHHDGPQVEYCTGWSQFKCIIINNFKIVTSSNSDCYIGYEAQGKLIICKVYNICKNSNDNDNVVFIVKVFKKNEIFFDKPVNSFKLGIAIVDNLSNNFEIVDVHTTFRKYMILRNNECVSVAYPILHSNSN